MPLIHRLLQASYQPLRLKNNLLSWARPKSKNRLRVLIYHDIAPSEQEKFELQLRWLSQRWKFVSPDEYFTMLKGDLPIKGDKLLLTFDDGFASNRRVAEEILNPMGIKAIFFVVTDFIDILADRVSKDFIAMNINLCVPAEVPAHCHNMSWDDLKFLVDNGHTIGAHTATHTRLSKIENDNLLEREICSSADKLEHKLGIKVENFAYTFGDLASFSPAALSVATRRFSFIYTGLRGNNAGKVPPWAIRRDAMQARDSLGLVGALLEGGADLRYARHLSEYERWGKRG